MLRRRRRVAAVPKDLPRRLHQKKLSPRRKLPARQKRSQALKKRARIPRHKSNQPSYPGHIYPVVLVPLRSPLRPKDLNHNLNFLSSLLFLEKFRHKKWIKTSELPKTTQKALSKVSKLLILIISQVQSIDKIVTVFCNNFSYRRLQMKRKWMTMVSRPAFVGSLRLAGLRCFPKQYAFWEFVTMSHVFPAKQHKSSINFTSFLSFISWKRILFTKISFDFEFSSNLHLKTKNQKRFPPSHQEQPQPHWNFSLTRQVIFFRHSLRFSHREKTCKFESFLEDLSNWSWSKMRLTSSLLVILGAVALANCEVFFEEKFLDGKRLGMRKFVVGCVPVMTTKIWRNYRN